MDDGSTKRFRALFISDIHLGTRASQAAALVDFLRDHDADTIYLVGDIFDFWRLRHDIYWPQAHNDVVQKLMRKARKGTRIVFVPGNHDEALREFCGATFGNIELVRDSVHRTADGRSLLITHGDEFDAIVTSPRLVKAIGDQFYALSVWANGAINRARAGLGLGHWSLSAFLKRHVKKARHFIGEFETSLAGAARQRGHDGVVCGHIHHAADKMVDGIHYLNCGDWVESCTALAEHKDGRFELIRWHERSGATLAPGATAAEPVGLAA